jgi:processive 1,2-diacylglycerol beta-glucosyltransferase
MFLHSPVGRAHLEASRAVSAALGPTWQREELDYLRFLPDVERWLWPALYHGVVQHAPTLWRAWRHLTDGREPRALRDRVSTTGARAFADLLRERAPRLVVSTIGGAAALAGAARGQIGARFVNALVVTHFRAHRHWARAEADIVFVATDAARADLVAHGLADDKIVVAGTPIRPGVRALDQREKRDVRARLGLGGDPVIAMSSGGTGVFRGERELLAGLEALARPVDVLVFRGEARGIEQRGRVRVHRLGFRSDYTEYLAASDACVGKIGSLTAAEACAAAVPIIVWRPLAGPEEANADFLVSANAALWPRSRAELHVALARVLDGDGERLARGALALHRPGAAARIVRELEARC